MRGGEAKKSLSEWREILSKMCTPFYKTCSFVLFGLLPHGVTSAGGAAKQITTHGPTTTTRTRLVPDTSSFFVSFVFPATRRKT